MKVTLDTLSVDQVCKDVASFAPSLRCGADRPRSSEWSSNDVIVSHMGCFRSTLSAFATQQLLEPEGCKHDHWAGLTAAGFWDELVTVFP